MLAVSLLDLNDTPTSSNPNGYTEFKDAVYFRAFDADHGEELWHVNRDGQNAQLFRDVVPGPTGSTIDNLTPATDHLYFTIELTDEKQTVVYATDGTPANTKELARFAHQELHEFREDEFVQNVHAFTAIGDQLYFMAHEAESQTLWTSDGTREGTHSVTSLPGTGSSITASNGQLYIRAFLNYEDAALYRSDGTNEGTRLFIEHVGGSSRNGSDFVVRDDTVFFQVVEDDEQTTLYRADPAPDQGLAQISQLFRVSIGDDDGFQHLSLVGDDLFFTSDGEDVLWKTSGIANDIVRIGSVDREDSYGQIQRIIDLNGAPMLVVRHGLYGTELWTVDAQTEELSLLEDINPGLESAEVDHFVQLKDELYFSAVDDIHGRELWATDGTSEGTRLVRDIRVGTESSISSDIDLWAATSDRLFFSADDGSVGNELWHSDGTTNGTTLLSDVNAGETEGSYPHGLTAVDDSLLFVADDGVVGSELWATNVNNDGARLIYDGVTGSASSFIYHQAQVQQIENLEFDVYSQAISFLSIRNPFLQFQGDTYFLAGQGKSELLKLPAGSDEPQTVSELRAGTVASRDINGAVLQDRFVFTTYRIASGFQLWVSDGTEAGTQRLKSFVGSFEKFVVVDNRAYFSASTVSGEELWATDGTKEGTVRVSDAVPGRNGVMPQGLTARDGVLYFSGVNRQHSNWDLWRSDGTEDGTYPITDYEGPKWTSFMFGNLHASDQGIFFVRTVRQSQDPLVQEYQLWKSDGALGSEIQITSVVSTESDPKSIWILDSVNGSLLFNTYDEGIGTFWAYRNGQAEPIAELDACTWRCSTLHVEDNLFFTADDGIHGTELWQTDGSKAGTKLVADIDPGPHSSNPSNITLFHGDLVFSARTRAHGAELWSYFEADTGDANRDGTFNSKDLVTVFEGGKYEQPVAASWSEGDWNGDGFFDSSDLVAALANGDYSHQAKPSYQPSGAVNLGHWLTDDSESDEKRKGRFLWYLR